MPPASSDLPRQPPPVTHHRLPDPGTEGGPGATFNCHSCGLVLALTNEVVSRAFNGRLGRAYLLNTAINVTLGPCEDRILQTGKHTVQDCMCRGCGERVGWRYEAAAEIAQRYKEGKVIIERECVVKDRGWDREVD